jgi:hypothetical protein
VIPYRLSVVPEVLKVQEVPLSDEVTMVPEPPTVTTDTVELSVLVVLDELLDELLDEVQDMEMKLKRRRERMVMSRCFTWFPIGYFRITLYLTSIGLIYNVWGDRVVDVKIMNKSIVIFFIEFPFHIKDGSLSIIDI